MTNVRNYTNKELIDRMKNTKGFCKVPEAHHIIAVRSNEDEPDRYDDKLYLFHGEVSLMVIPCTTHAGLKALKNPFRFNKKGVAVVKADEVYNDAFQKTDGKKIRHHGKGMSALRQMRNFFYYRDGNKDGKIDEEGKVYEGNYSTNVHANSYKKTRGVISRMIGAWSYGCLVINDLTKYYKMLSLIPYNKRITYTLLKEFEA